MATHALCKGREWMDGCWRRGGESNSRIKVLQTSPLPLGYRAGKIGAGNGIRTRDFDLGKVALYH